jgi:ankyrin repeat protein
MQMNRNIFIITLGLLFNLPIILLGSQARAEQLTSKDPRVLEFLQAARTNDTGRLRQALALGVSVDSRDDKGRTALLISTYANAIDAARILIAAGADVNTKDKLNDSPYLYAGAEGMLEILKMTVSAGADLKSVNRYGGTALTPAAHHGHVDVVRYLLTTDIDVNQVNNLGWTALLEAVILGDGRITYQKIVDLLLNNGADQTIGDDQGVTPLQHARSRQQEEIVRLLELAR